MHFLIFNTEFNNIVQRRVLDRNSLEIGSRSLWGLFLRQWSRSVLCQGESTIYPQNLRTMADLKKAITNLAGYPKDNRISTHSWRKMILKHNANTGVCMWNSHSWRGKCTDRWQQGQLRKLSVQPIANSGKQSHYVNSLNITSAVYLS